MEDDKADDEVNIDMEENLIKAHVVLPTQQEIEQRVLEKRKKDLLEKLAKQEREDTVKI